MSSLLQSVRIACSFTVFTSVRIGNPQLPAVPIQRLRQRNQLLCEFENFAVTSDAIKRIFTNFKNFAKIREVLRILSTEVTNSQSMY